MGDILIVEVTDWLLLIPELVNVTEDVDVFEGWIVLVFVPVCVEVLDARELALKVILEYILGVPKIVNVPVFVLLIEDEVVRVAVDVFELGAVLETVTVEVPVFVDVVVEVVDGVSRTDWDLLDDAE